MGTRLFISAMVVAVLVAFPGPAPLHAEDSGGCHCFQNRTYDPAEKFAADDYIRATALNSMVARMFSVPKRKIVMLRMNGLAASDMITGFYLEKRTGLSFDDIRDRRSAGATWASILSDPTVVQKLPPALSERAKKGATDEAIVRAVEDLVLESYFSAAFKSSAGIRGPKENIRDTVLALTFSKKYGGTPADYRDAVLKRQKSWGEWAASKGVTPHDVGPLVESVQP